MAQMMVDAPDIPDACEGDVATLLGGTIGVAEYARWSHCNRNEALARLSRRVPRVYLSGGQTVAIRDYME